MAQGTAPLDDHLVYDGQPTNENTLLGNTSVLIFDQAQLSIPDFTVSKVQLQVAGVVGEIYIGTPAGSGDAWDAASLTQVTFDGNPGVTQEYDETTLSDLIDFTWNKTDDLLVSLYPGGIGGTHTATAASAAINWYVDSNVNVAADLNKSSMSDFGAAFTTVSQIIMYGN